MQHEVLVWSQATLGCNICTLIYELYLKSSGHYCCLTAVSAESATRRENIVCLLLQLLLQPGVNAVMASVPAKREVCVVLGYAVAAALSCVSQERINVSAVPTSPQVFFQPFTLCFVCRGFSQQYRQWTARQLALWVASAIQLPFQYPGHLPKPGIKPVSLTSLTLAGRLPSEPPGKNKVEYSINGDCNYYYCSDKCLIFLKCWISYLGYGLPLWFWSEIQNIAQCISFCNLVLFWIVSNSHNESSSSIFSIIVLLSKFMW